MNRTINTIIGILLFIILLASIRNYSLLKIGVGQVYYFGGYSLSILALYSFYLNKRLRTFTYIAPILYIAWAFFGVFRGAFEVSNGFVLNQYFHGILYVLVPICIFLFALPETIIRSFQIFNIFAIAYSFLSFGWNYNLEAYCFALTPFYYLYLCFLTKIPKMWLFLTVIAVALVLSAVTNRSATVKVAVSVCVFLVFLMPKILQRITLNITHALLYIVPIALLYLGISGQYNVFQHKNEEGSQVVVGSSGVSGQQESHSDTRTFLYEEVFASMVIYDCFDIGRSPAKGYFSPSFADDADASIPGVDIFERFECEVGHLNTLNWLGIFGLLLMTLVYVQGSCLALYFSKNKYLKCLSIEVAFMWMWAWVENSNHFYMLDLIIYVMLAMCYSPYFRKMSDMEFEMFFKSIFRLPGEDLHDYNKYIILKSFYAKKLADKSK